MGNKTWFPLKIDMGSFRKFCFIQVKWIEITIINYFIVIIHLQTSRWFGISHTPIFYFHMWVFHCFMASCKCQKDFIISIVIVTLYNNWFIIYDLSLHDVNKK